MRNYIYGIYPKLSIRPIVISMNMDTKFARDLIKGKITETIFELMFREEGRFTVIPIGYEHTMPELIQCKHHTHVQHVLDNLRDAPDFALISQDKSQVYLVECKYRSQIYMDEIRKTCSNIHEKYHPCFLFVATREGFFYENCREIINSGSLPKMDTNLISAHIQAQFCDLLNKFC